MDELKPYTFVYLIGELSQALGKRNWQFKS